MANSNSGNDSLKGQWTALLLAFLCTVTMFIPYVGYSTHLTNIMNELNLSYTMAGMLASVTALAGGIVLLFSGIMVDRWGAKNVTVLGLLICCIGQVIFSYMPSYLTLLYSRLFLGAGIAMLFVAPYSLAVRWFERSNKSGMALGIMVCTDGIGSMLTLYVYSRLLDAYGWRTGSLYGAGIVLVTIILAVIFMKEPPHFAQNNNKIAEEKVSFINDFFKVLKNINVIVAAVFMTGVWACYGISVLWVPTILIEQGWSTELAGFLGALLPFAGIVGSLVCGPISDRMGKRKPLLLLNGIFMTAAFFVLAFAVNINNYVLLAIMLPISGLFAYGGYPNSFALACDSVGAKSAGTANGIIFGISFIFGGLLFPLLLGYVKDVTGHYTTGFITAAVTFCVMNILFVLLAKEGKKGMGENKNINKSESF